MAIKFNAGNISSPTTSTYSITDFNGVDYTTTPVSVDDSRAIELSNYLPDGNGLRKRNGIEQVTYLYETSNDILNVWKFKDKYVVHVKMNEPVREKLVYYNSLDFKATEETTIIMFDTDLRQTSCAYEYYDNLIMLINGRYLRIYEENGTLKSENMVENSYIPTAFNELEYYIDNENHYGKTNKYEDLNLLNNKCYLTSTVAITGEEYEKVRIPSDEAYYYDIKINFINPFSDLKINSIKVVDGENMYDVNNFDENTITIIKTVEDDYFGELEEGEYLTKYFNYVFLVEYEQNEETFPSFNYCRPYGTNGYNDRLFFYGSSIYPNVDIHTGYASLSEERWKDLAYISTDSYQALGSSSSAITGYGILSNGNMAIFKQHESALPNLYIRTPRLTAGTDSNGFTYSEESYPIVASGIELDCNEMNQVIQFDNNVFLNAPGGLYRLDIGTSTASQTYQANEVSYMIRNDLSRDLTGSKFVVFQDRLYLYRKNKDGKYRIYVADKNRYTFVNSVQNYEWWVIDDISVDKFVVIKENNKDVLYILNDFALFKINDKFYDYRYLKTNISNINDVIKSEYIFADRNGIILSSKNPDNKTDNYFFKRIINSSDIKQSYIDFKDNLTITSNDKKMFLLLMNYETKDAFTQVIDDKYILFATTDLGTYELFKTMIELGYKDAWGYANKNAIVDTYIKKFKDENNVEKDYYCLVQNYGAYVGYAFNVEKISISKLFTLHNNNYYDLEECEIYRNFATGEQYTDKNGNEKLIEANKNYWVYVGKDSENNLVLGTTDDVLFNILVPTLNGYDIYGKNVTWSPLKSTTTVDNSSNITIEVKEPVKAKWLSRYNHLGTIGILKTASNIYFVPNPNRPGETHVGYRTSKRESIMFANHNSDTFDFNEVYFDDFFNNDSFGRTYSSKKKIKNFSFIQLKMYSTNSEDSSIAMLSFKYTYTKNNKGVK